MADPWNWPNGIIPNSAAVAVTGLVLLITWFRKRQQIRWWLRPDVRSSLEGTVPLRGSGLRQALKAGALLLLTCMLVFFVFTSALIAMLPVYALEAILNPKH